MNIVHLKSEDRIITQYIRIFCFLIDEDDSGGVDVTYAKELDVGGGVYGTYTYQDEIDWDLHATDSVIKMKFH